MEIYHLVPTVDDKKHYVGVFDQKIKNYLWSILMEKCRWMIPVPTVDDAKTLW